MKADKSIIEAIKAFNEEHLQWRLKVLPDNNKTDARVGIMRTPMMMAICGEIIIRSDVSFEECKKEYQEYWDFLSTEMTIELKKDFLIITLMSIRVRPIIC